ncbi:MAG TPA: ABC transporter substrate-binding protein [Xanthobacteraceae bacterium]|nr:ABC transporter substrate-binding protein [Xanthobacteraceae bacterium]
MAGLLLVLSCLVSSTSASTAAERVRIMVGGVEKILYLPAKLAEQLGYYKDEGLDVELISVTAGSISETGLLSGSAEAVVGAYEQSIHIQAKGKYVTSIVQISASPQEALMVSTKAPEITSVAGLKGKTIAVTGFGSLTHFLSQDILVRGGLKVSDASFIAAGAGNTFISAFQQGRVQAGMTQEPTISILVNNGDAKVLVDLRTPEDTRKALGGDYPGSALYVRADWLEKNKATAAKLAHAFTRALHYIATHSAADIAGKMPPSYYNGNKDIYLRALANSIGSFTPNGRMPGDGPKVVLGVLTQFGNKISADKIDLSKTYTNEFVSAGHH